MRIEITVPLKFADEVVRDLTLRGGTVSERSELRAAVKISGLVLLHALSDYGADLRSLSDGHGTFRMEFDHDEADPSRS